MLSGPDAGFPSDGSADPQPFMAVQRNIYSFFSFHFLAFPSCHSAQRRFPLRNGVWVSVNPAFYLFWFIFLIYGYLVIYRTHFSKGIFLLFSRYTSQGIGRLDQCVYRQTAAIGVSNPLTFIWGYALYALALSCSPYTYAILDFLFIIFSIKLD